MPIILDLKGECYVKCFLRDNSILSQGILPLTLVSMKTTENSKWTVFDTRLLEEFEKYVLLDMTSYIENMILPLLSCWFNLFEVIFCLIFVINKSLII